VSHGDQMNSEPMDPAAPGEDAGFQAEGGDEQREDSRQVEGHQVSSAAHSMPDSEHIINQEGESAHSFDSQNQEGVEEE